MNFLEALSCSEIAAKLYLNTFFTSSFPEMFGIRLNKCSNIILELSDFIRTDLWQSHFQISTLSHCLKHVFRWFSLSFEDDIQKKWTLSSSPKDNLIINKLTCGVWVSSSFINPFLVFYWFVFIRKVFNELSLLCKFSRPSPSVSVIPSVERVVDGELAFCRTFFTLFNQVIKFPTKQLKFQECGKSFVAIFFLPVNENIKEQIITFSHLENFRETWERNECTDLSVF